MTSLTWLDPSINSSNAGDEIIANAVRLELESIVDYEVSRAPTQTFLNSTERRLIRESHKFVVGGTNLLNGNIPRYIQWKLDPGAIKVYANRVSLMGVGWWQYQPASNRMSSWLWRHLLSGGVHSVRDEYTRKRLGDLGVDSINTGCPTMWRLPEVIKVDSAHPTTVVATLTDYHRDPERDLSLLKGLASRYQRVVIWPQGAKDKQYVEGLVPGAEFLDVEVDAFDQVLQKGDVDYIGTRLHAGIRALQYGVRALIVAIDNRASEIAADTSLPTLSKHLTPQDWARVEERSDISLTVPHDRVNRWRDRFAEWVDESSRC